MGLRFLLMAPPDPSTLLIAFIYLCKLRNFSRNNMHQIALGRSMGKPKVALLNGNKIGGSERQGKISS